MIYKLKQRIEPVRRRANTVAQTVFAEHSFAANYQALKAMEPNLTLLQGSSVRGILWRGTNAYCDKTDCTVAFGLIARSMTQHTWGNRAGPVRLNVPQIVWSPTTVAVRNPYSI